PFLWKMSMSVTVCPSITVVVPPTGVGGGVGGGDTEGGIVVGGVVGDVGGIVVGPVTPVGPPPPPTTGENGSRSPTTTGGGVVARGVGEVVTDGTGEGVGAVEVWVGVGSATVGAGLFFRN